MRVIILADYRGVLTNEVFYPAGEHDIQDDVAMVLVQAGRASYVDPPAPPERVVKTKRAKREL